LVQHASSHEEGGVVMMDMTGMPMGMMWGMALIWVLIVGLLLLGIAALVKHLRS
jgi:hypothetical protein